MVPLSIGHFRSFYSLLQWPFIDLAYPIRSLFTTRILRYSDWLISDHQSLINGHGRLRVPPFTSYILLLIRCFILIHVTMKSPAPNFTITTASSADPRFITTALLQRLGLKVSQLHRPKADGLSLGKIVTHFSVYLPSIPQQVTVRISGFGGRGHLTPLLPPYEGSLSFR